MHPIFRFACIKRLDELEHISRCGDYLIFSNRLMALITQKKLYDSVKCDNTAQQKLLSGECVGSSVHHDKNTNHNSAAETAKC